MPRRNETVNPKVTCRDVLARNVGTEEMRSFFCTAWAACLAVTFVTTASAGSARSPMEQGWAAYERGDYELAARLIRPYAEDGDPEAQFKLGRMFQEGQGVPQDHAEAGKWYRLSAEAGQPFAQNNLGVMYKHGRGVKQDNVQAYFWFSLAAKYYLEFEEMNLERARQNRQSVASKMTPDEISEAQALVRSWDPTPYADGASAKLLGQ
jgi:TPR repeat protein